jgi:large subunit ribosomal protein L21e
MMVEIRKRGVMPQKSYGKMRGTRKKLQSRGKLAVNAYLQEFKSGDHVHIDFEPSSPIQHPRFQGLTGTILKRRGRNYIVQVHDGQKLKQVFVRPEHLKLQK